MTERKLLSIVVPTKDRYPYLKKLIELIVSFHSDDIELVIQDNSNDNREFSEYLKTLDKDYIKYNYIQGQIPMSKNSDNAILNSSGEYVCFIGDDDGVTIDIIECARYMKSKNIDAVRSVLASYYWPEVGSSRFVYMGGRCIYDKPTDSVEVVSTKVALEDLLRIGFIDRGRLPLVYHGIVSRKALNLVYEKVKTFFPGSSPDISSGVALSLVIDKVYNYNKIVTFSGASKFHGGGVYTLGKKHPELSDIKWLLPGAVDNWDYRLPKIGEGYPIWCDSSIKALTSMGRSDLVNHINFENLYVHFALHNKDLIHMSLELTNSKMLFFIRYSLGLVKKYYRGVCEMIWGKFNKIPSRYTQMGLENIMEASSFLHSINLKYSKNK